MRFEGAADVPRVTSVSGVRAEFAGARRLATGGAAASAPGTRCYFDLRGEVRRRRAARQRAATARRHVVLRVGGGDVAVGVRALREAALRALRRAVVLRRIDRVTARARRFLRGRLGLEARYRLDDGRGPRLGDAAVELLHQALDARRAERPTAA